MDGGSDGLPVQLPPAAFPLVQDAARSTVRPPLPPPQQGRLLCCRLWALYPVSLLERERAQPLPLLSWLTSPHCSFVPYALCFEVTCAAEFCQTVRGGFATGLKSFLSASY